jgi:hypothetical protein
VSGNQPLLNAVAGVPWPGRVGESVERLAQQLFFFACGELGGEERTLEDCRTGT